MTRKTISAPFILRYVYGILAVIVVTATVAIAFLYIEQHDETTTRDRIEYFNLGSYAEVERLSREARSLLDLAVQPPVIEESGDAGTKQSRSVRISSSGILHSMRSRLNKLTTLQERYQDTRYAQTLERLIQRFDRIETDFRNSSISPDTITAIEALSSTIQQFSRLHTIAIETELQQFAERQSHRPRFLAVLLASLGLSTSAIWYLISSLRKSLWQQKKAETELSEAQERLHNIQKLDALARLVGGFAHDFNNLLTAILGNAELLQEKSKGDESTESSLSDIRTAGTRAASLTQQLLAFSRRQQAHRRVMNLNDLLRDMAEILQRTAGEDIELSCDYLHDPCVVDIDPGQLQQVLMNLTRNARDAMPNGGALSIATENIEVDVSEKDVPVGEYVRLTVSDTGAGMDEDTRRRVFEPFFTTKEPGHGTGLGLSMVHGVVTDSKGHIVVQSTKGEGARFDIYYPRAQGRADARSRQVENKPAQKGSETILVVDDDEQILRFVEKGLSSLGYRVLTAPGALEGLKFCETHDGVIHAIVSDVIMSGTNGPAFMVSARRLRPDAVCVFMSGYTDILWRNKKSDGIPFITKPFELEVLTRHIRDGLDRLDDSESSSKGS